MQTKNIANRVERIGGSKVRGSLIIVSEDQPELINNF